MRAVGEVRGWFLGATISKKPKNDNILILYPITSYTLRFSYLIYFLDQKGRAKTKSIQQYEGKGGYITEQGSL